MPRFGTKNVTPSPSCVRRTSWVWLKKVSVVKYVWKLLQIVPPLLEFCNGQPLLKDVEVLALAG